MVSRLLALLCSATGKDGRQYGVKVAEDIKPDLHL